MRGTTARHFRGAWYQSGTSTHFGSGGCMGVQNWNEFATGMERLPTSRV